MPKQNTLFSSNVQIKLPERFPGIIEKNFGEGRIDAQSFIVF